MFKQKTNKKFSPFPKRRPNNQSLARVVPILVKILKLLSQKTVCVTHLIVIIMSIYMYRTDHFFFYLINFQLCTNSHSKFCGVFPLKIT